MFKNFSSRGFIFIRLHLIVSRCFQRPPKVWKDQNKASVTNYKKLCLTLSSIVTPCQAFIKFLPEEAPYNFHTSFSCPCLDHNMFLPGTSFLKTECLLTPKLCLKLSLQIFQICYAHLTLFFRVFCYKIFYV